MFQCLSYYWNLVPDRYVIELDLESRLVKGTGNKYSSKEGEDIRVEEMNVWKRHVTQMDVLKLE